MGPSLAVICANAQGRSHGKGILKQGRFPLKTSCVAPEFFLAAGAILEARMRVRVRRPRSQGGKNTAVPFVHEPQSCWHPGHAGWGGALQAATQEAAVVKDQA